GTAGRRRGPGAARPGPLSRGPRSRGPSRPRGGCAREARRVRGRSRAPLTDRRPRSYRPRAEHDELSRERELTGGAADVPGDPAEPTAGEHPDEDRDERGAPDAGDRPRA